MTAIVSAFARAYHYENNDIRVFSDSVALKLLSEEEYNTRSEYMTNGISFFNPNFKGNREEALRWIVEKQLAPTPLARAAFAEKSLERAIKLGVKQYLVCAAGLDTFAYRMPEWAKQLQIFELDYPTTSQKKQKMLKKAGIEIPDCVDYIGVDFMNHEWGKMLKENPDYDEKQTAFCTFLGMVYYFSKSDFESFLQVLSDSISENSTIVFDYPSENYFGKETKHVALAKASNEAMKASYSYEEMTMLLQKYHFQVFEHLNKEEMTQEYFSSYNFANPEHEMEAQDNVNYCLAVKKL